MKLLILIIALTILSLPAAAQRQGSSVGEIVGGAAPTAPYSTGVGQVVSPAGTSPLSEREAKEQKGLVVPYPRAGAEIRAQPLQAPPEKVPGSYYGPEVKSSGQYYPPDVKTDGRYKAPERAPEVMPAEGVPPLPQTE
jgi:hypothetical protein